MQTYSHLILTSTLAGPLKRRLDPSERVPPVRKGAMIIGSFMPDFKRV